MNRVDLMSAAMNKRQIKREKVCKTTCLGKSRKPILTSIVSTSNIETNKNDKLRRKGLKDYLASRHAKLRKNRGHLLH